MVTVALLAFWTWRRARGSGTDPTLRLSGGDGTGSLSFLASGIAAVGLVAAALLVVLAPEIAANPELGVVIVAVVIAHLYLEVTEA